MKDYKLYSIEDYIILSNYEEAKKGIGKLCKIEHNNDFDVFLPIKIIKTNQPVGTKLVKFQYWKNYYIIRNKDVIRSINK